MNNIYQPIVRILFSLCIGVLASCQTQQKGYHLDVPPRAIVRDGVVITLKDQKLALMQQGKKVKEYDISSSKFGIGGRNGSRRTPTGIHAVTRKVGEGQPVGMVFKACRPTGEVVPVDAAGRDPVVTRVIQLAGLESFNRNSHSRRIYIHGTPEERKIGSPASYGCIRMRSSDVIDLYRYVYRGMPVAIETCSQATYMKAGEKEGMSSIVVPDAIVRNLPNESYRFRPGRRSSRSLASRSSGKRLHSRHSRSRSVASASNRGKAKNLKKRARVVRVASRRNR